jgi:hypothetical protein
MNPIVALYRTGTAEQLARGRSWYPNTMRHCGRIAQDTGMSLERVTAVLAITSPDAQLVTNLRWARAWAENPGTKVGRYPGRMVRACWRAMALSDPAEAVTGPKVRAFYDAILGDTDALVLDRWALRLATGSPATTVGNRREAERLYREAADELKENLRDLQAIIWTIGREAMTRPDGTRVKLVDIHDIEVS